MVEDMAMKRTTLDDLAQQYFARREGRVQEETLRAERGTVGKLTRWWDKTRRAPGSLGENEFDDFLNGPTGLRIGRMGKVQASTYNTQLSQMTPFIKWLVVRGVVAGTLLHKIQESRQVERQNEFVRLTLHQLEATLDAARNPRERWIVAVGAYTFCRESELRPLRLRDVDLQTQRIRIYRKKTDDYDSLPIMGELDDEYRRWLKAYQDMCPLDLDSYTIPARDRGVGTWAPQRVASYIGRNIQWCVAQALRVEQEELKGQACHILRRTGARLMYDALRARGHVNAKRIVMVALGHKQESVTERYLGIREDREERDELMTGARLLTIPRDNVVRLHKEA